MGLKMEGVGGTRVARASGKGGEVELNIMPGGDVEGNMWHCNSKKVMDLHLSVKTPCPMLFLLQNILTQILAIDDEMGCS